MLDLRRSLIACGIIVCLAPAARCQANPAETPAEAKQFHALIAKLADQLKRSPAFAVELASSWKIDSSDKSRVQEGRNRYKLVRQSGNLLRIEANPGEQLQPTIICVCDGKT